MRPLEGEERKRKVLLLWDRETRNGPTPNPRRRNIANSHVSSRQPPKRCVQSLLLLLYRVFFPKPSVLFPPQYRCNAICPQSQNHPSNDDMPINSSAPTHLLTHHITSSPFPTTRLQDESLALARMLQEQERAYYLMQFGGGGGGGMEVMVSTQSGAGGRRATTTTTTTAAAGRRRRVGKALRHGHGHGHGC